jgi:hypothetical protein
MLMGISAVVMVRASVSQSNRKITAKMADPGMTKRCPGRDSQDKGLNERIAKSPLVHRNPFSRRFAVSRSLSPGATAKSRLSHTSKLLACLEVMFFNLP